VVICRAHSSLRTYIPPMARKPLSAEVIQEGGQRFVETIFDDGEIVRTLVDPTKKPTRRPRKPIARARVIDYTRKKRI